MPGKLVTKLTRMNKKGECGSPGRFFPAKFLFFHYAKLVFVSVSVRLFYSETLQGRTTQRKKLELRKHQQIKYLFLVIFQSRLIATDRTKSLLPVVSNQHELIIMLAYIRQIQSYQEVLQVQHNSVSTLYIRHYPSANDSPPTTRHVQSLTNVAISPTINNFFLHLLLCMGWVFVCLFGCFQTCWLLNLQPILQRTRGKYFTFSTSSFSWGEVMLPVFRRQ